MIPHIVLIQSAWSDLALSARRLAIARQTSIASLSYQTRKPVIHLAVSRTDPLLDERIAAYRETGCEVRPLIRDNWLLYNEAWELPAGRKLVSRIDDDDIWATDFCERLQAAVVPSGEYALIWPIGHVYWRERWFRLVHVGNQFVSLLTDRDCNPHQECHWLYPGKWRTINAGDGHGYGWIWVRHGDAATSTLPRYRRKPLPAIDTSRFPLDWVALTDSLQASGTASGNYAEHANLRTLDHVLRENAQHARSRV